MTSTNEINGHYARILKDSEIEKLSIDKVTMSDFKQNKLEAEAKKNWDLFYKRNKGNFFKDRHWTKREFEELANHTVKCEAGEERETMSTNVNQEGGKERPILLEVGCGAGNFMFPLISEEANFYFYACDFAPRAVQLVKDHDLYDSRTCHAFVCDITKDDLADVVHISSVDIATLIFVLSAIHPEKMLFALQNIFKVLKPNGILLFRDYGLYDQAMLRFKPGHKLSEHFYVRQDGTRAFYFSEEYLENLVTEAGFQIVTNKYVSRETVNHKEGICVPRVYIQGKFLKPS